MSLVYTALVTPFNADGSVDLDLFKKNIDAQLKAGIHGLVVCGSTGEGMTLSVAEKEALLTTAVQQVSGRVPVIFGAGHANTQIACFWQKRAAELGATHTLHVTPWYIKPTPEGLYAHFAAIASVNELPIILYNVPGRTQCDMPVEVILKLAHDFPSIIGIKECNLGAERLNALVHQTPKGFQVFSGEDAFVIPLLDIGGHGVISVWSNLVPAQFVELVTKRSPELAQTLADLSAIALTRPNPIPIKTAMQQDNFRLPLLKLAEDERQDILTKASKFLIT